MTLDKLMVGKRGTITKVAGSGNVRKRLLDMGMTPRTVVTLFKKAPLGDPIEVMVRGYHLVLRLEEARLISITTTNSTV